MKKYFFNCLIYMFLAACTGNTDKTVREEALKVAAEYIKGQSKAPERNTGENGTVSITDGETKYILDPSSLFTGFLDDDDRKDAIMTVYSFYNGRPGRVEHLIMIDVDGNLIMQVALENDMKILEVKDGIITAEIHTHPKSSPLYDCPSCMEAVKYRYVAGELVRAE